MTLRIRESAAEEAAPSVVLENHAVLVTLLPERGGEIHRVVDRRSGLDYLMVDDSETTRGFLTMFPNAATAGRVDERDYEFHGDVRDVAWDVRIGHGEPGTPVHLTGRSRTVPAMLRRRLVLDDSVGRLSVTDELVHTGEGGRFPYIYGLHPYHGYPLIDEGTVLTLGPDDVVTLPARTERVKELYDARESTGVVEVYNPRLDAGFRLTYEPDEFPYVWVWVSLNPPPETPYVVALLPCTNTWAGGIETALELGTARWLGPGESATYSWQLEVF